MVVSGGRPGSIPGFPKTGDGDRMRLDDLTLPAVCGFDPYLQRLHRTLVRYVPEVRVPPRCRFASYAELCVVAAEQ